MRSVLDEGVKCPKAVMRLSSVRNKPWATTNANATKNPKLLINLRAGKSQPNRSRKAKYRLGYMRAKLRQARLPCTHPKGSMRSNVTVRTTLLWTSVDGTATRM